MTVIIEKIGGHEHVYDVNSRLLKDRVVMLTGPIDDILANDIVGQLLFLDGQSNKEINMYINSPGGSVSSGLAILDTMRYIKAPVNVVCLGQACSMAAVLLACATGKRKALPHAEIMIHQPMAGFAGQATDIEIQSKQIQRIKTVLTSLVANATKQPYDKVKTDMERDFYMSSQEALDYGIIDGVVAK